MAFFDKDIRSWRDDSHAGWVQRRPADVSAPGVPGNPGGSPLDLRHPVPAIFIGEIPTAIVIRRPGPGLIADPIPAGVGSLPVAAAIRTPIARNVARSPAAPIGADNHPFAVR